MLTEQLKAAIREEVTRQLDEREAEAKKDLEAANDLMARVQLFQFTPPFNPPRVGPSMLIDHDPKDAA